MTLKTLLVATAITVIPVLSYAQCGHRDAVDQQAMTCLPGTQWDQTTAACVPVVNS